MVESTGLIEHPKTRQPATWALLKHACALPKSVPRHCLAFRVVGAQSLRRLPPDVAVVKITQLPELLSPRADLI
jgi:hypothetical protein